MPELPEVETVVRTLRPHLLGLAISRVQLLRSDILKPPSLALPQQLVGRSLQAVRRRGKKILLILDKGATCFHLGMTGRLTIEHPDAPLLPHTHLILSFHHSPTAPDNLQLRFRDPRRFGAVTLLTSAADAETNLGPEPLTLRPNQLHKLLARTRRPIKSALLDQSLIAGLGNIYADESLFVAALHPLTPANHLSHTQIRQLTQSIKLVLRRAIRAGGSSLRDYVDANGSPGRFQNLHNVYARHNQPCRKCHTPIQRIVLTGRSTHFCPHCQRLPSQ